MNERQPTGPRHDPWTAAIYAAADPHMPIGSGVVVDENRILTCRQVVDKLSDSPAQLSVSFPKVGLAKTMRHQVRRVRNGRDDADVAILELSEPAPPEAMPAPLRSPNHPISSWPLVGSIASASRCRRRWVWQRVGAFGA
jgi:hypothetical protein